MFVDSVTTTTTNATLASLLSSSSEEEDFFESLERLPSSASTSGRLSGWWDAQDDSLARFSARPSYSINDNDDNYDDKDGDDSGGGRYDVWMAEPGSITERRQRLLQGMGLSNEMGLLRITSLRNHNSKDKPYNSAIKTPPLAALLRMGEAVGTTNKSIKRIKEVGRCLTWAGGGGGGAVISHPLRRSSSFNDVKEFKDCGVIDNDDDGKGNNDDDDDERAQADGATATEVNEQQHCIIRNLDNGKLFIVREDGMWDGRQLSTEEFERSVGYSPIVHELMRRESFATFPKGGDSSSAFPTAKHNNKPLLSSLSTMRRSSKRRGGGSINALWLMKNIRVVASNVVAGHGHGHSHVYNHHHHPKREDRGDVSSGGGGAEGEGSYVLDASERMKVRQHGKSYKELTGLYMCQEIQGHEGSIWSIKFSHDGRYLATAGEDCVIHVWQVSEAETGPQDRDRLLSSSTRRSKSLSSSSSSFSSSSHFGVSNRKHHSSSSVPPDYLMIPDTIFLLSEKPICSFEGHLDDVLDLSWSKSQHLLSSSMDKTVRLWHMSSKACLKLFAHNDYVTCIQFNPVDNRYFISGSLDAKVRIWSIPDRQVVDWSDLHEMVTAACYTPDGQGALVGSNRGSCHLFSMSGCKLQQKSQIDMQNKKKKSHAKKITGFQFAPGSSSEVLVTSADSRIRIFDGTELIHKYKGFRNTSSQISASFTADGKYIICASEDSNVYVWKHEDSCNAVTGMGGRNKWAAAVTSRSHEHFPCRDVSVAIPWPGSSREQQQPVTSCLSRVKGGRKCPRTPSSSAAIPTLEDVFLSSKSLRHLKEGEGSMSFSESVRGVGGHSFSSSSWWDSNNEGDINAAAAAAAAGSSSSSSQQAAGSSSSSQQAAAATAWGLVVVTGGLGGEIRTFQNFGLPIRL
ncbi:uncharacterized protein LOC18444256 [Amborella trichopoda]|uniref:Uncharacterized protein n=1 Tax=Amborella trichopoda TaxID=13333 RepID=U5D6F9_AMBTC|nr:uncharacterized protein LOC18444256 [Amborella trichopoda]XP_020529297.1 uncharacterized protein LOC18444256 [Amborella trichopoda]ERN15948.1 hypothetical protein AMTR_s00175p00024710 [Amborella trichopoda]|eukprot:XP_020529296.1 uncharacterized protein LOC18444256 [Amborella trichopoda]